MPAKSRAWELTINVSASQPEAGNESSTEKVGRGREEVRRENKVLANHPVTGNFCYSKNSIQLMSLQRHVKAICVVRQTANTWFRALKLNPRTLWSRFIAVGKIRKGKAGQRFKEEMPSAKPGHLSFLSKHGPEESGWNKGSYSWIKIYFNSKAGWGRIGPGSLSHLYFSLWKAENAIRMLVSCTCVWMFSWARQRKKRHMGGGDAQRMHLPLEGLCDEHCRALFLYLVPLATLWDGCYYTYLTDEELKLKNLSYL